MSLKEKILKNKKLAAIIGATALVCVVALVVILLVCCGGKDSHKNNGGSKGSGDTTISAEESSKNESTKDNTEADSTDDKSSEESSKENSKEETTKDLSNNDSSYDDGTGDNSSSEINRDELRINDGAILHCWNWSYNIAGESESISNKDSVVYIERGQSGVVIVNLKGSGSVSLPAKQMKAGTYIDRVTGNEFTVSGGTIKGNVSSEDGIAVVYNTEAVPYASVSKQGGTMTEEAVNVTIELKNAVKGTYKIDGGQAVEFTDKAVVEIGKNIPYGATTKLEITATDGDKIYTYNHVYNKNIHEDDSVKFDENSGKYVIYMKNTAGWEEVYCYMWIDDKNNNKSWPGIKMTKLSDDIFIYATDTEYPNIIFNNGSGTQTSDMLWPGNGYIYENRENNWREK